MKYKTKAVFFFVVLISSFYCFSQQITINNFESYKIFGKVKQTTFLEYDYDNKFGTATEKLEKKIITNYDESGNIVLVNEYDKNEKLIKHQEYSYNGQRQIILYLLSDILTGEESKTSYIYKDLCYEKTIISNKTPVVVKKIYQLDNMGNIVDEIGFNNDVIVYKQVQKFNQDKLISVVSYSSEGVVSFKKNYTYDINYRLIKLEENMSYSRGSYITCYIYDNNNDLVEINRFTTFDSQNDTTKNTFNNHLLTETNKYYADGSLEIREVNTYNNESCIIEKKCYASNDRYLYTINYKYDTNGNFLERNDFNDLYFYQSIRVSYVFYE